MDFLIFILLPNEGSILTSTVGGGSCPALMMAVRWSMNTVKTVTLSFFDVPSTTPLTWLTRLAKICIGRSPGCHGNE